MHRQRWCCNREVICIDEPEAFLHPGLAETLGREVCKAAKDGDTQVFIATHSPYFLTGAIQSGANINIVRLTYQDEIGTARVMPNDRILKLMREPKFRSVGMLPALFANHVVVTGEVIKDRREIVPTPTYNFQIGEVRLPHLVDSGRLILELICRLHHDKGRAGDQIMLLPGRRCKASLRGALRSR